MTKYMLLDGNGRRIPVRHPYGWREVMAHIKGIGDNAEDLTIVEILQVWRCKATELVTIEPADIPQSESWEPGEEDPIADIVRFRG